MNLMISCSDMREVVVALRLRAAALKRTAEVGKFRTATAREYAAAKGRHLVDVADAMEMMNCVHGVTLSMNTAAAAVEVAHG